MPEEIFWRVGDFDTTADTELIISAVEQSHLNALRMALYQQTADPDLAAMGVEHRELRGGAMFAPVIAHADRAALKKKAVEYLLQGAAKPNPPPSKAETRRLLYIFGTPPSSHTALEHAFKDLAFQTEAPTAGWKGAAGVSEPAIHKVTIIGAGVSGLAMAISLKKLRLPFEIIERQGAIGGTWALNDYPGARVDVSNFVYQFRFEQKFPWKGSFADQAEIKKYLEHIAEKYGLLDHIRFNTSLEHAHWDTESRQWKLQVLGPGAKTEKISTQFLISASGLFATAKLPDIRGLNAFAGKMFHTTAWDHAFNIDGKRVALIGNGSSASQLMPRLAQRASKVSVFQRTPNWVLPSDGFDIPVAAGQRWLLDAMPYYWNWYCFAMQMLDRQIEPLQTYDRNWQAQGGIISERNDRLRVYLEAQLRARLATRPDLIEKCLPSYPPASRRMVVDNGWFDALLRPNVELVTMPIAEVSEDAIITGDGVSHPVDLIVLGSGFNTSRYLWPAIYRGRDGVSSETLWAADGARAHLGTTLPWFPNFFMFYGPNGQPRAGGFPGWAELWANYVAKLIAETIGRRCQEIEVKDSAFSDYNNRMDAAMKDLIWGDGNSRSYYINEQGRSGVNMPWTSDEYYSWLAEPNFEEFAFH